VSLAIEGRPARVPLRRACKVLGLNRSSVYQRRRGLVGDKAKRCRKQSAQPRALSEQERESIRETLRSDDYRNQPPAEVHERLLEKGEAPCSVSTMHRLLRMAGENGERRNQRPAQHNAIPRLKANAPNQVWTGSPRRGTSRNCRWSQKVCDCRSMPLQIYSAATPLHG